MIVGILPRAIAEAVSLAAVIPETALPAVLRKMVFFNDAATWSKV